MAKQPMSKRNGIENQQRAFYARIQADFGISREEAAALLRQSFSSWDPKEEAKYRKAIQLEVERRRDLINEQLQGHALESPKGPPCPVCGAPTYGDHKWYGKYTKTPSWFCSRGGHQHYLWARSNEWAQRKGWKLPYPVFEGEQHGKTQDDPGARSGNAGDDLPRDPGFD